MPNDNKPRKRLYEFNIPYYAEFMANSKMGNAQRPGFIVADPACHALLHYAMMMKENLKNHKDPNEIKLEASTDQDINHRQVWKSIALMYGVEPEEMVKYWPNVTATLLANASEDLPERYKMRQVAEINTMPRQNDA